MRNLRASLDSLSRRGTPIGSTRLRERVALELAGAGLSPEPARRRRLRGPLMAGVAAAVALIAGGGLILLTGWPGGEPAEATAGHATATLLRAATPLEPPPPSLAITWEQISAESFTGGELTSLATGGPGVVGVGMASDGYYSDAAVWISPDGRSWTRVADDTGVFRGNQDDGAHHSAQWMADITVWRGGFIAVGSDGLLGEWPDFDAEVWLSPDGVTWTRVPEQDALGGPGGQFMCAVTVGGPGLVAVGLDDPSGVDAHAAVWLSEDGLTWTRVDPATIENEGAEEPGGLGGAIMNDVVLTDGALIAVGTADPYSWQAVPAVWLSRDGATWDQILLDPGVEGDTSYSTADAVAVSAQGIAVVGRIGDRQGFGTAGLVGEPLHGLGAVWMSEDGASWRLAAVLDAEGIDDPGCTYREHATAALWADGWLLVTGEATTTCQTRRQRDLVWASGDLGRTWHELALFPGREPKVASLNSGSRVGPLMVSQTPGSEAGGLFPFGSQLIAVGGGDAWLGSWRKG
jgi:hypothetical protein